MDDIKKLKADVKAAERDVANAVNGLKNASAWTTTTYSAEQLKFPSIQKFIADKKVGQAKAEAELLAAKDRLKKVTEIAVAAVEYAKANPTPADAQKARDEANRRGEVSSNIIEDAANTAGSQKPDDFDGLLKSASKFIAQMPGPARKELAQQLNDALDLKLTVSELVDPAQLLGAYQGAITGAKARYTTFKDIPTLEGYLNRKKLELSSIVQAGGSSGLGRLPEPSANILNDTEAASLIYNSFNSLLSREATPKEIAGLTKELLAALRNPKNAQRATRNKSGVIEYSGGIKADQWLADKIKALPEYGSKVQAKQDIVGQGIEATARANGLKLRPEEIKTYTDRIKNGEDLKTIESQIRSIASLGQPDAIKKLIQDGTDLETLYSPYKRIMASSLGINPNTITLDDPTLRMAIGPDKEMSLYDYQKAIRKDNRWKYSQEANDEVTNMISQVKRDFGFMG
jgi:hypothetical protein